MNANGDWAIQRGLSPAALRRPLCRSQPGRSWAIFTIACVGMLGVAARAEFAPHAMGDADDPGVVIGDNHDDWIATVDALMLWQGAVPSVPVLRNDTGMTMLDARQVDPTMAAGPRFSIIRRIGDTHSIEGTYLNVQSSVASAGFPSAGGPFELASVPPFSDIQSGSYGTDGKIQSAELNWRVWNHASITWLAGFRWVEWDQQLAIAYAYENLQDSGNGQFTTRAGNNLYGGQIGADVQLWNRGDVFRVNAVGKTGVFYNSAAYQRSSAGYSTSSGVVDLGMFGTQADQTSFVNELSVNANYDVTKWLALRAGYTLLWLSGVAMAPNQLPLTDFGTGAITINTEGSVLLHGVTAGLEARW